MQGNVRNLPAHQHFDNAFCNPHAKWAYSTYNRTVRQSVVSTAARVDATRHAPHMNRWPHVPAARTLCAAAPTAPTAPMIAQQSG
eukprot:5618106-Prymnesium_polylepis.1